MKEFFKKIDWMIVLFIIAEVCNILGIVAGIVKDNPSAATWAFTATIWCAAAIAWYITWKEK